MEFTVKHSILEEVGLPTASVDSFHCGYCEAFVASGDVSIAFNEIKEHVRRVHAIEERD